MPNLVGYVLSVALFVVTGWLYTVLHNSSLGRLLRLGVPCKLQSLQIREYLPIPSNNSPHRLHFLIYFNLLIFILFRLGEGILQMVGKSNILACYLETRCKHHYCIPPPCFIIARPTKSTTSLPLLLQV